MLLICKVCNLYGTKFAYYPPNCMRVMPSKSTGYSQIPSRMSTQFLGELDALGVSILDELCNNHVAGASRR